MSAFVFSETDVRAILEGSEGVRLADGTRQGHTGEKHVNVSNAYLHERMLDLGSATYNNGEVLTITSFITFADTVRAGAMVLNSDEAEPTLTEFYRSAPRRDGWVLEDIPLPAQLRARYAQGLGGKTFPCSFATMVIDKDYRRHRQIHVRTFFPSMGPA
jgi:hypothetical protein